MSLPISIVQDPYFEHHINLLDKQYKTLERVRLLEDALCQFEDEESFFKAGRDFRSRIINHVQDHPVYPQLQSLYTNLGFAKKGNPVRQTNIYRAELCGKRLISLDLRSANFQCFKKYVPELVDKCKTYHEFASEFSDIEYFLTSKKIRQTIFGNLNPKLQQKLMKEMTSQIMDAFSHGGAVAITSSSDEVVFDTPMDKQFYDEIAEIYSKNGKFDLNVTEFVIEEVPTTTSSIFVKRFPNGAFALKCCRADYVAEVLRHLYGEKVHPYDRMFYNDGRVCEYKDSLFE
jgi:hypothetical protein